LDALVKIIDSKGPRLAWIVSDLMRFVPVTEVSQALTYSAFTLLGKDPIASRPWSDVTDLLMAWDIPAPLDYLRVKRAIFTGIVPGWEKIFVEGDIDWRHVS